MNSLVIIYGFTSDDCLYFVSLNPVESLLGCVWDHRHHSGNVGVGLKQLILISTDEGQDCFLITDRFQLVDACLYEPRFLHVFNTCPPCVSPFYYT